MDPIRYLTEQHRRIEALLARFERRTADRKKVFGQLERAIVQHSALEEMHVYPLLRERVPGGEALEKEAIDDHSKVELILNELDTMDPNAEEFTEGVRRIAEEIAEHVKEEETEPGLLEKVRSALDEDELEALAKALKRSEGMTPTRAHPLAPDRPPGNTVLGPATGLIDRARDALEGRTDTHRSPRKRARPQRRATTKRDASRRKATSRSAGASRARGSRAAPRRGSARPAARKSASSRSTGKARRTRQRSSAARRTRGSGRKSR